MALRPITITIVNNLTNNVSLQFDNAIAIHGTTPKVSEGPNPIAPDGGQDSVYAENSGMIGPQGSFAYQFTDGSGRAFNFAYNHPMGTGTTTVTVTPPAGFGYEMTVNHLPHEDAWCTIALYAIS